jgi:hypothetical protein
VKLSLIPQKFIHQNEQFADIGCDKNFQIAVSTVLVKLLCNTEKTLVSEMHYCKRVLLQTDFYLNLYPVFAVVVLHQQLNED